MSDNYKTVECALGKKWSVTAVRNDLVVYKQREKINLSASIQSSINWKKEWVGGRKIDSLSELRLKEKPKTSELF